MSGADPIWRLPAGPGAWHQATPACLPVLAQADRLAGRHPWNERHFQDSLQAGHDIPVLTCEPHEVPVADPGPMLLPNGRWLLGFMVVMAVLDEVHLLNVATVPQHQRQGHARRMMRALVDWTQQRAGRSLWLEVRTANVAARALYESEHFEVVGLRKGYYPAADGRREDALVMRRLLPETTP